MFIVFDGMRPIFEVTEQEGLFFAALGYAVISVDNPAFHLC